jgi:hypothetical protein
MTKLSNQTTLSIPTKSQESDRETMRMIEDDCTTDVALTRDLSHVDLEMLRGGATPQEVVFDR